MASSPASTRAASASFRVRPYSWTQEEYERAVEADVFLSDRHAEWLDGQIVERVSVPGPRHAAAVDLVSAAVRAAFGDHGHVRVQAPFMVDAYSAPEPDVVVVPGPAREHTQAQPIEPCLVVEIADDSLSFDREVKTELYAMAGVPDYWLVNLRDNWVEIRRGPMPDGVYKTKMTVRAGDTIAPLAAPDAAIPVADFLL